MLPFFSFCVFLLFPSLGRERYRLNVVDLDPSSVTSGGWLEDTSLVEKYEISDDAYKKRDGKYSVNYTVTYVKSWIHFSVSHFP